MRKKSMGSELSIRKRERNSDGVRGYYAKKSDGVRVDHEKMSDGVRV